MAKKRGRGNRGRYISGRVDEDVVLGALGTKTGVVSVFDETVNERTRVSSIDVIISAEGLTAGEPVEVGVAHSDYSLAEIEEYLENTGSWNEGNLVSQREIGKRLVRSMAVVTAEEDSKPVKAKLNWILNQGQTLDLWAYNPSVGSLSTGGTIHMVGKVNLWVK